MTEEELRQMLIGQTITAVEAIKWWKSGDEFDEIILYFNNNETLVRFVASYNNDHREGYIWARVEKESP